MFAPFRRLGQRHRLEKSSGGAPRSLQRRDPLTDFRPLLRAHGGLVAERHALFCTVWVRISGAYFFRSSTDSSITFFGASLKLSCVGLPAWQLVQCLP